MPAPRTYPSDAAGRRLENYVRALESEISDSALMGDELRDLLDADGSLATNPPSPGAGTHYKLRVGVLATDAQHGGRGGGTQHALANSTTAGFMSAADRVTLDSLTPGWLDPTPRLLDTLSCPVNAAYSLAFRLSRAWLGPCCVVRRDSDGAYANIGFVSGALDTTTLDTFCSGANGYVVMVYDQSGNGRHLTKSTASGQPKIWDASAGLLTFGVFDHYYVDPITGIEDRSQPIFTVGTQPAAHFDGSDDELKLFGGNNGFFGLGGALNTNVSPDLTVVCTHAIRSDWTTSGSNIHPTIYDFHSTNGLWLGRNSASVSNPPRDTAIALSSHFNGTATVWWDVIGVAGVHFTTLRIAAGGRYDSAALNSYTTLGTSSSTVSLTGTSTPGGVTFSLGSDAGASAANYTAMDWNLLLVLNTAALSVDDGNAIYTAATEHAA